MQSAQQREDESMVRYVKQALNRRPKREQWVTEGYVLYKMKLIMATFLLKTTHTTCSGIVGHI